MQWVRFVILGIRTGSSKKEQFSFQIAIETGILIREYSGIE
jgi:hypothetical protein